MRALVTKLLAILLLVPASLGCCWHSVLAGGRAAALECATATCQHCCDHCDREHVPAKPGKCQVECKNKSFYLPSPKPQVAQTQIVLPLDMLPERAQLAGRQAAVTTLWATLRWQTEHGRQPRLHALHCVFLI